MRTLVVIPVFNRSTMVLEALDSVAEQSVPPTAVVVVDDGSTDDTPEAVEGWLSARPALNAHLMRLPNGGAAAARNRGLREFATDMDAVAFLDSDDLWPRDFLARTRALLEREPRAVAVSCDRELLDMARGTRQFTDISVVPANPWRFLLKHGGALGSCTLFRVSEVLAAGGYPEDIPTGHDSILFGRIAGRGGWRHVKGSPVVFRRNHARVGDGDADHLHMLYPDYRERWAKVAEQLRNEAPRDARLGLLARHLIGGRWRRAAKQAIQCGERERAWRCLARAFRQSPWNPKNLHVLLRLMGRAVH